MIFYIKGYQATKFDIFVYMKSKLVLWNSILLYLMKIEIPQMIWKKINLNCKLRAQELNFNYILHSSSTFLFYFILFSFLIILNSLEITITQTKKKL